MPPRDLHPCITARNRERDARRRYRLAIAAAVESLRRAELRFEVSAAAIDAHIRTALATAGSLVAVVSLERGRTHVVSATTTRAELLPV